MAQRVDEPDARPARLADAGQVRRHEHLRARLEVRAVRDGRAQPRPDRPDDAERHRLGERVRVGRQERFERVGHRVDAGRGGDGRRQADGQHRVEDRRDRQQRRDGRCSPCGRLLVRDDGEASGPRRPSRRSSGPRRSGVRARGPGRRIRAPRPAGRSSARRSMAFAVSIDEPPPTGDDDRPVEPEVAQRRRAALDGRGGRGSARPRRRRRVGMPAAARHSEDRVDDARPVARPGSVTTKTREPPAAATTSGSRSIDPTPNSTRLRRTISNDRSASRVMRPPRRCRSRCRAGPSASAGSRTRGTSARSSPRRGCRRSRPRRSRARPGR